MNLNKCINGVKSQAINVMATMSSKITSETSKMRAQDIKPSKIWMSLDSKAASFLYKIRKDKLDKLFDEFLPIAEKMDLEFRSYYPAAEDICDTVVNISTGGKRYSPIWHMEPYLFIDALQSDAPEAKRFVEIVKQLTAQNAISFSGQCREMYMERFNEIISNL